MKKIYIAGKITGECETPELLAKCYKKFNDYTYTLPFDKPYEHVVHGLKINKKLIDSGNGNWIQYMKNDIRELITCDEVHFLPDWENSKGAKIEHFIAESLEMKIVYVLG